MKACLSGLTMEELRAELREELTGTMDEKGVKMDVKLRAERITALRSELSDRAYADACAGQASAVTPDEDADEYEAKASTKSMGTRFHGKGSNAGGQYLTRVRGKQTHVYTTWRNLLRSCYAGKRNLEHPTRGAYSVCDEWHEFQEFAAWFEHNYVAGGRLCLMAGSVYSPDTCSFFVPSDDVEEEN